MEKRFLQLPFGFIAIFQTIYSHRLLLRKAKCLLIMSPCHMIVPIAKVLVRRPIVLDAGWSLTDGILARGISKKNYPRLLMIFTLDFIAFHISNRILMETSAQLNRSRKRFLVPKRKLSIQFTGLDEHQFMQDEPKSELIGSVEQNIKKMSKSLTILFRGKINNESGFPLILETAKILDGYATFIFVLGKEHLPSIIPKNVILLSGITNSEMKSVYELADVTLGQVSNHSRLSYTIPHKAFEAAYFGKCYITMDSAGIGELLDNNSAILLKDSSAISLSEAIKTLELEETRNFYSKNIERKYREKASQYLINTSFDKLIIGLVQDQLK